MQLPHVDHLLILVRDLEAATADFDALGFTVQERADTKHGSTAFRFIALADGSYIMLTAFASPAGAAAHRLGPILRESEGWGDYAFVVADLDAAIARGTRAGLVLGKVNDVRNVVASGAEWGLRLLVSGRGSGGDTALPFLVQDVTGRGARIPAAAPHANGALGVAAITIGAADAGATARALATLLDLLAPEQRDGGFTLTAGSCTLSVVGNAPGLPGRRAAGGLVAVTLRCAASAPARTLDAKPTHYARIELRPEPA